MKVLALILLFVLSLESHSAAKINISRILLSFKPMFYSKFKGLQQNYLNESSNITDNLFKRMKSARWKITKVYEAGCKNIVDQSFCDFMNNLKKESKARLNEVEEILMSRDVLAEDSLETYADHLIKIITNKAQSYMDRVDPKKMSCYMAEARKMPDTIFGMVYQEYKDFENESISELNERIGFYCDEIDGYVKNLIKGYNNCSRSDDIANCLKVYVQTDGRANDAFSFKEILKDSRDAIKDHFMTVGPDTEYVEKRINDHDYMVDEIFEKCHEPRDKIPDNMDLL